MIQNCKQSSWTWSSAFEFTSDRGDGVPPLLVTPALLKLALDAGSMATLGGARAWITQSSPASGLMSDTSLPGRDDRRDVVSTYGRQWPGGP